MRAIRAAGLAHAEVERRELGCGMINWRRTSMTWSTVQSSGSVSLIPLGTGGLKYGERLPRCVV